MASKLHHPPPDGDEVLPVKRSKVEEPIQTETTSNLHRVELSPADCGLDFDIDANGLQGRALHEQGFAYCWSGARANIGIRGGKYCFGCKIVSEQVVDMVDTSADQQHVCRVGISRGDDPVGNLGETVHSFGFGGTGKFSSTAKFSEYGEKFGIGDTIVCAVNLEKKPFASVGFSKNGKWLGIAREFDVSSQGLGDVGIVLKKQPWESALFPHVLLKNVVVQLQFSASDGLTPEEGYKPWNLAIDDENAVLGPTFSGSEECEVIMMVGLPASGKTTWAEKWLKEHPEKRYILLGTNLALDLMKVPGLMRKHNYGERFDRLMDQATGIFNTLLARAAKTPRNYILDQTNVYKSARNRKLKSFVKYRKIAVVLFPTQGELKARAVKRFEEMGKAVPAEAVNEMLANYVLPTSKNMPGSTESFDEVIFAELSKEEAQRQLEEMKRALTSSSNLNIEHEFSSCSNVSSISSFPRPFVAKKESIKAFGGHLQAPQQSLLFSNSPSPSQAKHAYARPYFSVEHPPRPGTPFSYRRDDFDQFGSYDRTPTSFQRNETGRYGDYGDTLTSYGREGFHNFGSFDRTPPLFQRNEIDRYGSYDSPSSFQRAEFKQQIASKCVNPYSRSSLEESLPAFREMRSYQIPRSTEALMGAKFESPSPNSRSSGYSQTLPSYGSHGAHVPYPGVPQVHHHQGAMTDPHECWPHPVPHGTRVAAPAPLPPPRPSHSVPDIRSPMNYRPYPWQH